MMGKPPSGFAIWITGLPASGKTTLAQSLAQILFEHEVNVQILDSDDLRKVLTPDPSYSQQERNWFYQVLIFLSELLTQNGVNVIIAATGSLRKYRRQARERLDRYVEVYLDCPKEVCKRRDPKGLWERAEKGEVTNFPGADAPFHPYPLSPFPLIPRHTRALQLYHPRCSARSPNAATATLAQRSPK